MFDYICVLKLTVDQSSISLAGTWRGPEEWADCAEPQTAHDISEKEVFTNIYRSDFPTHNSVLMFHSFY